MKILPLYAFLLFLTAACRPMQPAYGVDTTLQGRPGEAGSSRLFMDLRFGMTRNEFMQYCKQMNAKGLFLNDYGNQSVVYKSDSAFRSPVTWRFFPAFRNDRIVSVQAVVTYKAYAPWNHDLDANHLLKDLAETFCRWYGPNNLQVAGGQGQPRHLVKKDGYREISIRKISEKDVRIDYKDLRVAENNALDVPSL